MEKNKHGADDGACRCKCACGAAPFLIGVAVALAFGWWIFPGLLFSKQSQPFFFSHAVHIEKVGANCIDCHSFRKDGTFTGLPKLSACADCHQDIMTAEPDEKSTPAEVAVDIVNLTGQKSRIPMREIKDKDAVYYMGEFPVYNRQTINFDIQVKPEGDAERHLVKMSQEFFTE